MNVKSVQPNIYTPGYLTNLFHLVLNTDPKQISIKLRLNDTQMSQISRLYYAKDFDVESINVDQFYSTYDNEIVSGQDLRSVTYMMYMYARSRYWKPDQSPMTKDSTFCGGVPLPLLGFKNSASINYNSFRLPSSDFTISDTGDITCNNIPGLVKLDTLLGYTLASTNVSKEGSISLNALYGLGMLCALPEDFEMTGKMVNILRLKGMHNKPNIHYSTAHGAAVVKKVDCGELTEVEVLFLNLYNNSSNAIRLMLTQRWCWNDQFRNTDMILNFKDWDKVTPPISLGGISPAAVTVDTGLKLNFKFPEFKMDNLKI